MTSTVTQAADPSLTQSELDAPEAEQAPPGSANLQGR
jgi:hypothetical protein